MSYENQEFTEHTANHSKFNKNCEYCAADREMKTQAQAWEIIQKAFAKM